MSEYTKYLGKNGAFRPRFNIVDKAIPPRTPILRRRNIGGSYYVALSDFGNDDEKRIDDIKAHVAALAKASAPKVKKAVADDK